MQKVGSINMASYEDLQFVRAFKLTLDKLMEKGGKNSLTKEEIGMVYDSVMSAVRTTTRDKTVPLSVPDVVELDKAIASSEEPGEYHIHNATKVVFKKTSEGEYVAYGTLLDDSMVLKLSVHDVILCVRNQWRFFADRCLINRSLLSSSYAVPA